MAARKEKIRKTGTRNTSATIIRAAREGKMSGIVYNSIENDNSLPVGSNRGQVRTVNGNSIAIGPTNPQMNTGSGNASFAGPVKAQMSTGNRKPASFKKVEAKIATIKRKSEPGPLYLTKRILISATRKAFSDAAEETMEVMGFNLIAEDGWLVKVYKDGNRERISKLKTVPRPPSGKFFD